MLRPGVPEPEAGGPPVDPECDPGVTRQVSTWQYVKFNVIYSLIMAVLLPLSVQASTLPFYVATSVVVFKFGVLWGVLLVPVSYLCDLAMDVLWMMVVKK